MPNTPAPDTLGAKILLRVLRDPRVEAVAIEYYAHAELQKLIEHVEQIAESPALGQ